jgi:hypothetical protein
MVLNWERHNAAKEKKSLKVVLRPGSQKRGDEKNLDTLYLGQVLMEVPFSFCLSLFPSFF